jgi:predicted RNA-binding protein YlqC (UPF0109 family)
MPAKEFVEYLAQHLVNDPHAVAVREIAGNNATILELSVAADDVGRVIGKQGRSATAMRTLLSVVAHKEGKRITLEISSER